MAPALTAAIIGGNSADRLQPPVQLRVQRHAQHGPVRHLPSAERQVERPAVAVRLSARSVAVTAGEPQATEAGQQLTPEPDSEPAGSPGPNARAVTPDQSPVTLLVSGTVPSESWNRVGMKLVPKLRAAHSAPKVSVEFSVRVNANAIDSIEAELRQVLDDLGLGTSMTVRKEPERPIP